MQEVGQSKPVSGGHGRTVSIVTLLTFAVSALGYVRAATLAGRFGVSATMDAYFGATLIPNTLYLIVVVGTLSPIFIPILLQENASQSRDEISESFSVVTNFTLLMVVALVALGMFTARHWLPWLFPGFGAATDAMLLRLVYVIYPAVVFLTLAGIFSAVLNGFHKFALAAITPAISSVAVIAAAIFARGSRAIYIVGIATAVGFVLQFLVLLPSMAALGVRYRPIFNFRHPAIIKVLRLGGPLFLYLVVSNASLIIERNLASRLSAGAVSAMTYAMRLFTVPANFLAAPLAIVSYPLFAREAIKEKRGELGKQLSRTLRFIVIIFLPITVLLILNAFPLTRVLYERGRFRPQDSLLISRVLMLYGIGILPNAIAVILVRCFFAIQDTVTPLVAETIDLVFYAISATWLTHHFGIEGLAVARGMTFFLVGGIFALVLAKKRRLLTFDFDLLSLFSRTVAASLAMGIVNWIALHALQSSFDSGKTLQRLALLGVVFALSAATFLGMSRLLKLAETTAILKTVFGVLPTNYVRGL